MSPTYHDRVAPRLASMASKPRKSSKANWMSQPFNYGAKISAKIGKRVSIGNIACSTKPKTRRPGVIASERTVKSGIVAVGTRRRDDFVAEISSITRGTEEKPREQHFSNLGPPGDGQDLAAVENDYEDSLLNLDDPYDHSGGGRNVQEKILSYVERTLRNILILIGVYMFGVYQPLAFINVDVLIFISPMIGVAWCTCFIVQLRNWWMSHTVKELIEDYPNDRPNDQEYDEDTEKEDLFNIDPVPQSTSPLTPNAVAPVVGISNSELPRCFSEPALSPFVTVKSDQRDSQRKKQDRR